jgi:hypothetical protein
MPAYLALQISNPSVRMGIARDTRSQLFMNIARGGEFSVRSHDQRRTIFRKLRSCAAAHFYRRQHEGADAKNGRHDASATETGSCAFPCTHDHYGSPAKVPVHVAARRFVDFDSD